MACPPLGPRRPEPARPFTPGDLGRKTPPQGEQAPKIGVPVSWTRRPEPASPLTPATLGKEPHPAVAKHPTSSARCDTTRDLERKTTPHGGQAPKIQRTVRYQPGPWPKTPTRGAQGAKIGVPAGRTRGPEPARPLTPATLSEEPHPRGGQQAPKIHGWWRTEADAAGDPERKLHLRGTGSGACRDNPISSAVG